MQVGSLVQGCADVGVYHNVLVKSLKALGFSRVEGFLHGPERGTRAVQTNPLRALNPTSKRQNVTGTASGRPLLLKQGCDAADVHLWLA